MTHAPQGTERETSVPRQKAGGRRRRILLGGAVVAGVVIALPFGLTARASSPTSHATSQPASAQQHAAGQAAVSLTPEAAAGLNALTTIAAQGGSLGGQSVFFGVGAQGGLNSGSTYANSSTSSTSAQQPSTASNLVPMLAAIAQEVDEVGGSCWPGADPGLCGQPG